MGNITMSIPAEVTMFLKNISGSEIFLETGTFYGGTTIWAAENFKEVHTIEFSKKIYDITSEKYKYLKNINFHYGNSIEHIDKILPGKKRCIIWLDAHWCSGDTYGENDQCPLLKELTLINKYNHDHIILIDDARLFLSPPPSPHNFHQYPGISQVIDLLNSTDRFIAVYQDVIIAVPNKHEEEFKRYLQTEITNELERNSNKKFARQSLIIKAASKIRNKLDRYILKELQNS